MTGMVCCFCGTRIAKHDSRWVAADREPWERAFCEPATVTGHWSHRPPGTDVVERGRKARR